jgi:RimJ/RimL family protein N-acetyltransferase
MPSIRVKMIVELVSDFTLKDGSSIHIRPIQPEDDHSLVEIFNQSSPQTVYQRFFTPLSELTPAMVRHLSNVDYCHRLALIAETEMEPVGVARYEPTTDPGLVELGLVIVDGWQNRGLGRILLREILRAAEGNGIHRFCAEVLGENHRMLHLLATEARIQDCKTEAGVTTVSFTSRRAVTS